MIPPIQIVSLVIPEFLLIKEQVDIRMNYSLNAFELDIPDIVADIYKIDPQPSKDSYRLLGKIEWKIEKHLNGKAHKWRHSKTDDWYIAIVGSETRESIEIGAQQL